MNDKDRRECADLFVALIKDSLLYSNAVQTLDSKVDLNGDICLTEIIRAWNYLFIIGRSKNEFDPAPQNCWI